MTLEQQAWKERGGFGPSPTKEKPPTAFDWIARVVATLILLGLLTVSVWAITLVSFGGFFLGALLTMLYVHLFFKVRDVARDVRALKESSEAMRPPPEPPRGA